MSARAVRSRAGWFARFIALLALLAGQAGPAQAQTAPSVASEITADNPPSAAAASALAADSNEPAELGEPAELSQEERTFFDDLKALTRRPHRLAGSPYASEARQHIERRLKQLGVSEVYPLDMKVWQTRSVRCELMLDGRRVPLHPLRPNIIVNPITEPGGLKAPLLYAGSGTLAEYGQRDPAGSIVVLDYASGDAWERAFSLGARAVIFLGEGEETPAYPKRASVPSNQLRFYAAQAELGDIDLRRDWKVATLFSEVVWEKRVGRNLVARIKGTDADFAATRSEPEALVLAANYDSFGVVPEVTPAARAAANVVALLEAAGRLAKRPPKRDVLLMFLDNQGRAHQGAHAVYAALELPQEKVVELFEQALAEQRHLSSMRRLLERKGIGFRESSEKAAANVSVSQWLGRVLTQQANDAGDDARRAAALARLVSKDAVGHGERSAAWYDARALAWDQIRRALYENELPQFVERQQKLAKRSDHRGEKANKYLELVTELSERTTRGFDRRLAELAIEARIAKQRLALRQAFGFSGGAGSTFVALHVTYAFGDQGPTWGPVVGDWTYHLFPFRTPKTEADKPGYYGRVLSALAEAKANDIDALDERTLSEPNLGVSFAVRPFFASGAVAGLHGRHNLSFMTGYDGRLRDGHPADTLERLGWRRLREQAHQGTSLIASLANGEAISVAPVFSPMAELRFPTWEDGRSRGDYAGLLVSGSLSEDRPASDAIVALWPGNGSYSAYPWTTLTRAREVSQFDPVALVPVDENGRFELVAFRQDIHEELMSIAGLFDQRGQLQAITTDASHLQKLSEAMRIDLFFANGGNWSHMATQDPSPWSFKLLKANSDAQFRQTRVLAGQHERHGFYYVSQEAQDAALKLFQPRGPVVLGSFTPARPSGTGVLPEAIETGLVPSKSTAEDLWALNESRFATLRERGVTSADLESLHGRARRIKESARAAKSLGERETILAKSAALSHRVYQPLRASMDDLVHAIVILLLLTIPFAFALERLLIGASGIYGRIAGFAGLFLATFAVLYWLHPGFAVASTPIIILLAFAIILLSALVIYIVVRKFDTELGKMRGEGVALHAVEVSRAHTLMAAINLGMSTMRRRPTRTILTTLTVVVLTFTILSFASFTRSLGVRSIYEGPLGPDSPRGILVRKLDYSSVQPGLLQVFDTEQGETGLLAPHYWFVRLTADAPRIVVTRTDTGKSLNVEAVMGVEPEELSHWPALGKTLGVPQSEQQRALKDGQVFLPGVVKDLLQLEPGDEILLAGERARFAGTTNGRELQRLRHLDNQSVLPVDFQDAATQQGGAAQQTEQSADTSLSADVVRDFVHVSSDQVVIASADFVKRLGGQIHSVMLYPDTGVNLIEQGQRLAELTAMPVWAAGADGIERQLLTVLTEVSGGGALFIPLLLGGLIIFGTLLGSISDREKEIYTFSALGLSPGHVGVLFFAEASVYAIIGGVGGQLLAQVVGRGVVLLSQAGLLPPVSINYSSTNSLFAIGVVMLTVLVSAIYPAVRASKSANPGLQRSWKMPAAEGDDIRLTFPFTVSAYDITGVVSFLAEHFRQHDDAGLGNFAASGVKIQKSAAGNLELASQLALAPFDLGVTERLTLTAKPSEIEGVDEVAIHVRRLSGAHGDWHRANRAFMRDLRRQFLLWRTLSQEHIEQYRLRTLEVLGHAGAARSDAGSQKA